MKKKIVVVAVIVLSIAALAAAYILARPALFPPKIQGELRVIGFSPQGAEVPISADGVAVMFDRAVVPLTTLDGGRQKALPLTVSPGLPGRFVWLGTSGFILRPEEPMKPATTYRVELAPGTVSVEGFKLEKPLSWEFETVAPRLLTMEPGDGGKLLPAGAAIFMRFNLAMDRADVEKNVRFTDEVTGGDLSAARDFIWGDGDHTLLVLFKGELPWAARIKATVPAGLKAAAGNIGTRSEVSFVYETPEKKARVEKVAALDMEGHSDDGPSETDLSPGKEILLSGGTGICYVFTQPMKKKSFERAFKIEPPKAGETAPAKKTQPFFYFADYEGYETSGGGGRTVSVEGYRRGCASFLDDYDRSYSFSIDPTKIEFLSKAALEGGGETYSVKTGRAKPSLKSLLTKNILSANGPMRIPYRSVNVSDVTVRLYRVTDPLSYDEEIRNETVWDFDPKEGEVSSRPIGSSSYRVPVERASMAISQARMPADMEMKVPVDFRENLSTRFFVDLSGFDSKPSQGIWLIEAIPTPSVETKAGELPRPVYSMVEISSVGLAMKRDVDRVLAWVTDIESGEPVEGLSVSVSFVKWNSEKGLFEKVKEASAVTDASGVAAVAAVSGANEKACAEAGGAGRFAWSCEGKHGLTGYRDTLRPGTDYFAYIYTDRPVYRPGQKVHFSSFVREVREGRYFMPGAATAVEVVARDASGAEVFRDAGARPAAGGMVSGSFDLPSGDGAPRGAYEISFGFGEQKFTKAFVVTSYRKPSFKVDVTSASREIVSGDTLKAEVSGQYFFGAPMRAAAASWSIMTSTYVFAPDSYEGFTFVDDDLLRRRLGEDGEQEYVSDFEYDILASSGFGTEIYAEDASQYDDPRNQGGPSTGPVRGGFFRGGAGQDTSFVPARLGDDGKLPIDFRPDLKKYPTSQTLSVDVGVTDPSMQQVSASEDVIVHKGEFYIGLRPARWVWGERERAEIGAVVLDTAGKPAAGKSFEVEVIRREYKFIEKRNAAGFWDFVFTPQDIRLATLKGKSDASGAASLSYGLPQGGEFRFVARAKDSRGNEVRSAVSVYAWGEGYVPWRMERAEEIELVPDKEIYRVGETAKVLVKSLMPVTKALVSYERGRVLEYTVSEQGGNATHIEIPVEQGMIPNFFLSVVAHAGRDGERPPLLFYGETAINVEPETKRLSVALSADRKGDGESPPVYRPGENVTVNVKTSGADGKPLPAHVIVSVADESVLRLLGYKLPDLVKRFYYRRPSGVVTSSSMVSLKAGDAGGAGRKRRIFKDTASFVADLSTDAKGEGSFSFVLPDDLTTWVVEAVAATEPVTREKFEREARASGGEMALSDGNFVGGARTRITSTLPLVLRAALPRFAAWGDKPVGSIIANNRRAETVKGEISYRVEGGASLGGKGSTGKVSMEIPAGEERAYPVKIEVADGGDSFSFAASASGAGGEELDALEVAVPVKDRFSPETVATSGMTEDRFSEAVDIPEEAREEMGGLKIRMRAALALAAAPNLKALIDFPYACSEQKSATLAALLFARELTGRLGEAWFDAMAPVSGEAAAALSGQGEKMRYLDRRIESVVSELTQNFMNYDGGLRYWPESENTSFFSTVQALWALGMARDAGFSVDPAAMERMRGYVRERIAPRRKGVAEEPGFDDKAFGLWALSSAGAVEAGVGDGLSERIGEMSVTGASYLLMAMKNMGRAKEASDAAAFLLSQARRGPGQADWPASKFFWSSALKNTALASVALLMNDPGDPVVPQALRFVLDRKRAAGDSSTQDNLYAAWLVTEYERLKGEERSDFKASVRSEDRTFAEGSFDAENLLSEISSDVPTKELLDLDMPAAVSVEKKGEGMLYYDMLLTYYLSPDETPTREEGVIVSREYYALDDAAEKKPLSEFKVGENYRGHITVFAPGELNYVVVEERLPAGFEPVDMLLSTSSRAVYAASRETSGRFESQNYWDDRFMKYDDAVEVKDYGMSWSFRHQEVRDDSIIWSEEVVPAGVYHIRYPVRATTAGAFLMPGVTAFEFYRPEIFGRGVGREIRIKE